MTVNQILKGQVCKFILENNQTLNKPDLYKYTRDEFGLTSKAVSRYYIELERKGLLKCYNKTEPSSLSSNEISRVLSQEGNNLSFSAKTNTEIKSLDDLLLVCSVDTSVWEIISWQCKKWDLGVKDSTNSIVTKNLYSVSAKFRKIKEEENLPLQKGIILSELFKRSVGVEKFQYEPIGGDNMLELALFDCHFGKLSHKEESGEDYDLKIAAKRYNNAIGDLLSKVNLKTVSKILLPIGNDLINVDGVENKTTAGTPQDCDSRFYKIVRTVKELLISTIERLTFIAPVDVVICVGNHDQQTSFMIGEMLEAYFHNNENVNVDNLASLRKYYKFGNVSLMFTHGDKEKHANLGMIFAAENPKMWASTKQRYIQIGHFHHNRKIEYLSNQEFQGFQMQVIPSLSSSDSWHTGKGFMSLKQAKGFLYNKKTGLVGEFTHTVQ